MYASFFITLSFLSCQPSHRETIIHATQSRATELFGKDSTNFPFDSVQVHKISRSKDSLSYYKGEVFIGSSVIVYE